MLEAELRAFLGNATHFPTRRAFDRAGRTDLRSAVEDLGGPVFWADRLGLRLSARQLSRAPFSPSAAVQQAQRILANPAHDGLPYAAKLRRMGFGRLAREVQKAGGAAAFSKLHSLAIEGQGAEGELQSCPPSDAPVDATTPGDGHAV